MKNSIGSSGMTPLLKRCGKTCVMFMFAFFSLGMFGMSVAQSKLAESSPVQKDAAKWVESKPYWSQLTQSQQKALAPLQSDWASLDSIRKQKWLGVAARYQTMTVLEQERMHTRMQAWAKLSITQRQEARDNYIKTLSATQSNPSPTGEKTNLNEQWAKYQALPPERRAALQAEAEKAQKQDQLKSNGTNDVPKTKPLVLPSPKP